MCIVVNILRTLKECLSSNGTMHLQITIFWIGLKANPCLLQGHFTSVVK